MVKAYLRYSASQSFGGICSTNTVFDKTGKLAIAGSQEKVLVWNIRKKKLVRSLEIYNHEKSVFPTTTVICRSNDNIAAGFSDGSIRIWDIYTGILKTTFYGHRSAISCLLYNDLLLISGGRDTDIIIWDVLDEIGICRLMGHRDEVTSLVLIPNNNNSILVSSSKDTLVKVWDMEIQACVQNVINHRSEVWSLAIDTERLRIVSGSSDNLIRVWEIFPEGKVKSETDDARSALLVNKTYMSLIGTVPRRAGKGKITGMHYIDGLLITHDSKKMETFRILSDKEILKKKKRRQKRFEEKKKKLNMIEQPDEKIEKKGVTDELVNEKKGVTDELVNEEKGVTDELVSVGLVSLESKIKSFDFHKDSFLIGYNNNSMEVRKIPKSREQLSDLQEFALVSKNNLQGHRSTIRNICVSDDGLLIMSVSADSAKLWKTLSGECIRTFQNVDNHCAFFFGEDRYAVIGTKDGRIVLVDVETAEILLDKTFHEGCIWTLSREPSNNGFMSAGADKCIKFFKFLSYEENIKNEIKEEENDVKRKKQKLAVTVSFELIKSFETGEDILSSIYSINSKYLAVSLLDNTIRLYFTDSMKMQFSLYGHKLPVNSLSISDDSMLVASGSSDKSIKIWGVDFGDMHFSLRAHEEAVIKVEFLPSTHYLASISKDGDVKIWDIDKRVMITKLSGHIGEIWALGIGPDGSFLVTAGSDKSIRIWERGEEQLFLEEEREKEFEKNLERETVREDRFNRPSKRTLTSVRSTDVLMRVIDEARENEDFNIGASMNKTPHAYIAEHLNTLSTAICYEVLLALPFNYAVELLEFIAAFLDRGGRNVSELPWLESVTRVTVILIQINLKQLSSPEGNNPHRRLIDTIRCRLRILLTDERERWRFNSSASQILIQRIKEHKAQWLSNI
eukprot:GHVL01036514.1.p1 GENE.GHVL01036514.1~~GHVL01036514.1.p1  ORF type:complete len:905 (-),score=199.96 GHVL01036514.1:1014-3728(-)